MNTWNWQPSAWENVYSWGAVIVIDLIVLAALAGMVVLVVRRAK